MPDHGPGQRMLKILAYIEANPGCSKSDAARCGPTGPLYSSSVENLIWRGLVRAVEDPHDRSYYRLYATEAVAQAAPSPGSPLQPGTAARGACRGQDTARSPEPEM